MKIPTTLHISGFDWEVEWRPNLAATANCNACCHADIQKIYIDPSANRQVQDKSFLHELLHIIWTYTGMDHRYGVTNPSLEEEVVSTLSVGLYQILHDNNLLKER